MIVNAQFGCSTIRYFFTLYARKNASFPRAEASDPISIPHEWLIDFSCRRVFFRENRRRKSKLLEETQYLSLYCNTSDQVKREREHLIFPNNPSPSEPSKRRLPEMNERRARRKAACIVIYIGPEDPTPRCDTVEPICSSERLLPACLMAR